MDWTFLTAALAFTTLLGCIAFAFISKRQVDARREDPNARRSTLASNQRSDAKPADV